MQPASVRETCLTRTLPKNPLRSPVTSTEVGQLNCATCSGPTHRGRCDGSTQRARGLTSQPIDPRMSSYDAGNSRPDRGVVHTALRAAALARPVRPVLGRRSETVAPASTAPLSVSMALGATVRRNSSNRGAGMYCGQRRCRGRVPSQQVASRACRRSRLNNRSPREREGHSRRGLLDEIRRVVRASEATRQGSLGPAAK